MEDKTMARRKTIDVITCEMTQQALMEAIKTITDKYDMDVDITISRMNAINSYLINVMR